MNNKRLIEVDFPLKEVSKESAREKRIHHRHISTLHIWWARRPLAASRATTFAALIPAPKNHSELRKKLKFVGELSKWENSLNNRLIENAKNEIRDSFGGKAPKILDCFAGGGAIPLEALRLGCETHALELNPVAVLILKAVLEYPQKFGEKKSTVSLTPTRNPMLEDVKKWSDWVLEESRKEVGQFYPSDPDGSTLLDFMWARTVKCRNPSCCVEIPMMRQFWLSKKRKKRALKMIVDKKNKEISFEIIQGNEIDFDPTQGTTKKGKVLCPICKSILDNETIRKETREGNTGQRLISVMLRKPNQHGKMYRVATDQDLEVFKAAGHCLEEKIKTWKWDFNPIPDELLPKERARGFSGFRILLYGISRWGDLFNKRQKLALITFVEKIRMAYNKMVERGYETGYARAVAAYLAIGVDRLANRNSMLNIWNVSAEKTEQVFLRQALPMVWDYTEINPIDPSGQGWTKQFYYVLSPLEDLCKVSANHATVVQATATRIPYPDNFFDAVITDPPYYDNVAYGDLSDFFYVWLKRAIGDLYPEIFSTPLTPKSEEIIQDPARGKDAAFFEGMLTKTFHEIHRVLKPEGIATIVFAHKSTEAWETIINSLLRSGLVLTASWPIHTEMKGRLLAQKSAALASSVYMVCRKRVEEKIAYFNEIKAEIEDRIGEKLAQFWEQGISGADFFVSAIGPAVEVFGRYSKVEKLSGEEVSVQELLEYVRKIVSEFALERVLKRADLGGVDAETRFYLLWRWTFNNAKVPFDDAIKLSRPMGIELTKLWDRGELVKKEKGFIRVLGPMERAKDSSFMKKTKFTSMIDAIHRVTILWEQGKKEGIKEILDETGYAGNEIFWQTAQAISEILPQGDKEKQLLQGFLYGKETCIKEARRRKRTLLEFMESD